MSKNLHSHVEFPLGQLEQDALLCQILNEDPTLQRLEKSAIEEMILSAKLRLIRCRRCYIQLINPLTQCGLLYAVI